MRGLSGAVIVDNGNGTVTKSGGPRGKTREQGQWIFDHGNGVFPFVTEILEDGYIMEKLEHIEYYDVAPSTTLMMLQNEVWIQPAVTPPTTRTMRLLKSKMQQIIDTHLLSIISRVVEDRILEEAVKAAVGSFQMRHALSHGDPTAENVMYRKGDGNILIDPIPATETVPDSPAVDIGKMLQSAYSWETAKYNTGIVAYRHSDIAGIITNEQLLVVGESWAVVHVMRAIPYVSAQMPDAMDRVLEVLENAIERN